MQLEQCAVIIPALNPANVLVELVAQLHGEGLRNVVIINDGSSADTQEVFQAVRDLGAHVIEFPRNRGKGAALKAGFQYAQTAGLRFAITADADGQHLPADVAAVARAALAHSEPVVVLGVRRFTKQVPLRSRFGNELTQWIFRKLTGMPVRDTQTGLRAFPASFFAQLQKLQGDRYEYEMNVLVHIAKSGAPVVEVPISTVYLDENSSSHFRPLLDSARIYVVLLRDVLLALSSFGLDIALFSIMFAASGNVFAATYSARLLSGIYNFLGNKYFVFYRHDTNTLRMEVVGYVVLAILLASASGILVSVLIERFPMHPTVCKIIVDLGLYVTSFLARRYFVFKYAP
jgi:glycosyltransferase involved in cell wall biosynthesis